jgi:hypothetical protein
MFKMKMLSVLLFMLTSVAGLAFADQASSLPDFSKAFPEETLWDQTKLDDLETYSYATNVEFKDLKKIFVQFLGHGWTEVSMEEVLDDAQEGIKGSVIFTNSDHPGIQVGLTQMSMEFMEKQFMVNVTVLTESKKKRSGSAQ